MKEVEWTRVGERKKSWRGRGQNAGKWVQKGVWNRQVAPTEKRAKFIQGVSYAKCHFLSLCFFSAFLRKCRTKIAMLCTSRA